MRSSRRRWHLLGLLTLLACAGAGAQESSDVWVEGIEGPQYFAVLVEDVRESAEWYSKALGLEEVDGAEADDGSWRIVNLRNEELLVEIIRDDRATSVARARGFFKIGFQVADVSRVADRVARATGERPRVLEIPPHGIRIIQLRDPDGNVIQLSSPLETE